MYFTIKTLQGLSNKWQKNKIVKICNKIKENKVNINLCTVTVCSFSFM